MVFRTRKNKEGKPPEVTPGELDVENKKKCYVFQDPGLSSESAEYGVYGRGYFFL